MTEKEIEKHLYTEVKKLNGLCIKMNSVSFNGLPDRLVILPNCKIFFVELKAQGKKPRPLQLSVISRLRKLGVEVFVADNKVYIDEILRSQADGDTI